MKLKMQTIMAFLFLGFLALLFSVDAALHFLFTEPISIAHEGKNVLEEPGKNRFLLETDSYTVDKSFGSTTVINSVFRGNIKHCTYFNVKVSAADGQQFVMPVRVREAKRIKLERGESVALYGRVLELEEDRWIAQDAAISGEPSSVSHMCLMDNGETVFLRYLSALVFALAASLCIFLIILITRRSK